MTLCGRSRDKRHGLPCLYLSLLSAYFLHGQIMVPAWGQFIPKDELAVSLLLATYVDFPEL